jgi:hypothetical protein
MSEQYMSDPNSVPFNIEPIRSGAGGSVWLATYSSQGKTARFRLEFGEPTAMEDKESKHFDVKTGKGRFVAEPGQTRRFFCWI